MPTILLYLFAFQMPCSPSMAHMSQPPRAPLSPQHMQACEALQDPAEPVDNGYEQLSGRLNALLRALGEFSDAYRAGKVDAKKAKVLRKALRELQKSDWFKPEREE
jgi:hypothetical protein